MTEFPRHPDDAAADAFSDVRACIGILKLMSLEEARGVLSEAELSSLLFLAAESLTAALEGLETWHAAQCQLPLFAAGERWH